MFAHSLTVVGPAYCAWLAVSFGLIDQLRRAARRREARGGLEHDAPVEQLEQLEHADDLEQRDAA